MVGYKRKKLSKAKQRIRNLVEEFIGSGLTTRILDTITRFLRRKKEELCKKRRETVPPDYPSAKQVTDFKKEISREQYRRQRRIKTELERRAAEDAGVQDLPNDSST